MLKVVRGGANLFNIENNGKNWKKCNYFVLGTMTWIQNQSEAEYENSKQSTKVVIQEALFFYPEILAC